MTQYGDLREQALPYAVWGEAFINEEARKQMENALRLPISVTGALMPDAHIGYGLPIGGVLATDNAVIPYAVGVDIACRMRLTVYAESSIMIKQKIGQFKKSLLEGTLFGAGARWQHKKVEIDHPVLDDPDWDATRFLKSLHSTAVAQIGTSGSGNHFVEWGAFRLESDDAETGLQRGEYLALLSHSGSRAVGFKIANHYSEQAMHLHQELDKSVRYLAWLPLEWEIGQEYWTAMELAGRFAAANHEIIHARVASLIGVKPIFSVENHHNFAWKETVSVSDGGQAIAREVVVHRKGATPAGVGVMGIIPGSMGDPGYLVRGKGSVASLQSASHGAGRAMGRKQAKEAITKTMRDRYLEERGVILLGGGIDEAPQAYKPIEQVIGAQRDLVDLVGQFKPVLVRMTDEAGND
ncbi:MAG: RtcB family protein [Chloroflexota bacterium]|nr:RtcB family protein [Chloroflexota bacterium]